MKKRISILVMTIVITTSFIAPSYATTTEQGIDGDTYTHASIFDNYIKIKGIDVSAWQGVISKTGYQKMKAEGIDFVILRSSFTYSGSGVIEEDSTFEQNYTNANAAGMQIGIYHYSCATTTAKAVKEANYTLDLIDGKNITLPVYIDMEDPDNQSKCSKATLAAVADSFCKTIKSKNYKPGVYASLNWLNNKIGSYSGEYNTWVAQYYDLCQYKKDYSIWQYSSSGRSSGYSGRLDSNFLYLDDDKNSGDNSLSKATVSTSYKQYVYNGSQRKPSVTVTLNDKTLIKGTDYIVNYYKNVAPGTAYVVVSGIGSYKDCKIKSYSIKPYSLSSCSLSSISDFEYTGKAIVPTTIVKNKDNKTLVINKDYVVKCENNINAGTANITITGAGDYTGSIKSTFIINKANTVITSEDKYNKEVGQIFNLNASVNNGCDLNYTSLDETTATVDNNGNVEIKKFGNCDIQISALESSNYSAADKTVNVSSDTNINNLVCSDSTDKTITLSWDKVSGADSYNLYIKDNKTLEYKLYKNTTGPNITLDELSTSTLYTIKVCAVSPGGTLGTPSNELTITTKMQTITEFKVSESATNSATLTWDETDCDGYEIYYRKSSSTNYLLAKTIVDNSIHEYKILKLAPSTSYDFKICPYKNDVRGEYKYFSSATCPCAPNIMINTRSKNSSILWTKKKGNGYIIYTSTTPDFKDCNKYTIEDPKITNMSLPGERGEQLYVKMRAYYKYDNNYYYSKYSPKKYMKIK